MMKVKDLSVMGKKIYITVAAKSPSDHPVIAREISRREREFLQPYETVRLDEYLFKYIFDMPENWIQQYRAKNINIAPLQLYYLENKIQELAVNLGFFMAPIGVLDIFTPERISGWAWDPNKPNEAIDVLINIRELDKQYKVKASKFRKDLLDHGLGDGCHGFLLEFDQPLSLDTSVTATITDLMELQGSPKHVEIQNKQYLDSISMDDLGIQSHICIFRNPGRISIR